MEGHTLTTTSGIGRRLRAMIVIKNVHKKYDDGFHALKDINLEFRKGEMTVLIGPSGCGKSTTMRLINRLVVPTSGSITIDGKDIASIDPVELRRSIGYVIQSVGLFPHMTIARNVATVPRLKHWDKERIARRVDELLQMVGLNPDQYRDRYPSELSGGQQQRIGVIRALAADPDIILMDEPFSALDPLSREQLQEDMARLQQELHKTIIFVTHDMDEALKIADRIVLMKDGEVVQSDTPDRILRRPANDFVRTFIGQKRLDAGMGQEEALQLEGANASIDSPSASVNDVMVTQPAVTYPNRGLAEAILTMERRKVDSLYVVDRQRRLLGSVSIYNVLDRYGEEEKTVSDVMMPVRYVVQSGTPLAQAVELLASHRLHNVAVVDEGGRFIGLITRGSVVRHLAELLPSLGDGGDGEREGDTGTRGYGGSAGDSVSDAGGQRALGGEERDSDDQGARGSAEREVRKGQESLGETIAPGGQGGEGGDIRQSGTDAEPTGTSSISISPGSRENSDSVGHGGTAPERSDDEGKDRS
ncbi:Choline transport ATP-binding protein OpuBA [Paenibacillus sp. P22]|nr:Choline transport ATP-binding protein OpuBA [Paenibacillus sp. P22]